MPDLKLPKGHELLGCIVGPRYRFVDASGGVRSFKLEKDADTTPRYGRYDFVEIPEPISGAIWLVVWNAQSVDKTIAHYGKCDRCHERSKFYKRRREPALWRWARGHRCGQAKVV